MGTMVTTRKFKIVDLIRYKNPKSMIVVPKYPVEVVIDVTTKSKIGKAKEVPSSKMDRLERAARTELDRYEKIITEELEKFDAKIAVTVATDLLPHDCQDHLRPGNGNQATAQGRAEAT